MANGMAFLIFVVGRQVEWRYCLLAMVTCAVGGYSSARLARRVPQPVLRASWSSSPGYGCVVSSGKTRKGRDQGQRSEIRKRPASLLRRLSKEFLKEDVQWPLRHEI